MDKRNLEKWTRKLVTLHEAFHSKDDIDQLFLSRKGEGGGLANIVDFVDASIQGVETYVISPYQADV